MQGRWIHAVLSNFFLQNGALYGTEKKLFKAVRLPPGVSWPPELHALLLIAMWYD